MTDEDHTALKLQGYNVLVKFKDEEELYLSIGSMDTETDQDEWFVSASEFVNGTNKIFPVADVVVARDSIKYIIKI